MAANTTFKLHTKILRGTELEPYLDSVAHLRIKIFREYPYLYDGNPNTTYEKEYLGRYVNCKDSILIIVQDGDKVIGASTGMPMQYELEEIKRPYANMGYDLNQLFYCGESVLLPAYRKLGLYKTFFQQRELVAKEMDLKYSTFLAIVQRENHPLKPQNYQPLDDIWQYFGYQKSPHLMTKFEWKSIDEDESSFKDLVAWIKKLSE